MEAIPIPNDITIIIYRSFFFLTSGTGTQWCDGGWRSQSAEFNSPAPAPEFIGGGTDTYWWWSWCRKWWWWQWCLNAWIISKDSNPNRNVRFAELSMYSITRYLIPERILRKVKVCHNRTPSMSSMGISGAKREARTNKGQTSDSSNFGHLGNSLGNNLGNNLSDNLHLPSQSQTSMMDTSGLLVVG